MGLQFEWCTMSWARKADWGWDGLEEEFARIKRNWLDWYNNSDGHQTGRGFGWRRTAMLC